MKLDQTLSRSFTSSFVAAAVVASCAALLPGCASRGPEPLEIRDARLALQDAKSAGAEQTAPDLVNAAKAHLATAQTVWRDRGDSGQTIHYARLADSEARNAQFRARARRAQEDLDQASKKRGDLEIAVRDAELRAQSAHARTDADRQRMDAEARLRQERERMEAVQGNQQRMDAEARQRQERERTEATQANQQRMEAEARLRQERERMEAVQGNQQRMDAEARQRQERERTEAAQAERDNALRAANERVRALEASLEAERRKSAEQQQQAQIDSLKTQLEAERRAMEEARKASEAEVAAARRAADEERARSQEIERRNADRERTQTELLIRLQQVEKGTRVESRGIVVTLAGNVFFDSGKADVKAALRDRLAEVGKALASAPDRHILIDGHSDSTGKLEFNMSLSQLRAESVKAVLVANGVSPDRIETHGYGPSKPVAANGTPNGRSQNRRVELVIQGGAEKPQ